MTNIFGSPKKVQLKARLFRIAVQALEREGWTVNRVVGSGKSSVRRITKGGEGRTVSIRTSQDTWIAFPRTPKDKAWRTLSEVDAVVPVSVDDMENPRYALVHMIEADEMRDRFDRAYRARKEAGHRIPVGRGVWVALYLEDSETPVRQVGAGAGLAHPPFARVPLTPEDFGGALLGSRPGEHEEGDDDEDGGHGAAAGLAAGGPAGPRRPTGTRGSAANAEGGDDGLSIGEAKRRLALSLGVPSSSIKITIEA